MAGKLACSSIYCDGSYLAKTGGTWHLQDSPLKARWVMRMLSRHPEIRPITVCEVGCGAGGILAELQRLLPDGLSFTGYEISPQAIALSRSFENANCRYVLGDAFADESRYDLVLVMDVVEHVEDYFGFLRQVSRKGLFKLYHIPLETHVRAVLRGLNSWDTVGHLHLFTIETALKSIEYTGQHVIDWVITSGALEKSNKPFRTHLANVVRMPLQRINPILSARLLGGHSILILSK